MTGTVARTRRPANDALLAIQAPVQGRLDDVVNEMHRVVTDELPIIREVSAHLLRMRGQRTCQRHEGRCTHQCRKSGFHRPVAPRSFPHPCLCK